MTRTTTSAKKPTPSRSAAKATATDATMSRAKAPLLDLRGLLDKLKLPNLDVAGLIDSRRKDVEALLAANEQANRGFEAVIRRQREMLTGAMQALQEGARETIATQGASARVNRVTSQAQEAFGQALADMKEIAEMSARSQKDVVQTLNVRLRESLSETGARFKLKR